MCDNFAFIFDSGRLESTDYGSVVFQYMLKGGELSRNQEMMPVLLGDIISSKRYIDIEPYVLNDEYCTIDFDAVLRDKQFKDFPYCWIVENLSDEIARTVDKRLKSELSGYIGLARVDKSCPFERKQFWKQLVRRFSLFGDTLTAYFGPDTEEVFCYLESASQLGYKVKYSSYEGEMNTSVNSNRKQTRSGRSRHDFDRDILALNFTLRQEFQIAGVLLWKSVNALAKIRFTSAKEKVDRLIEYPFFALYFAAQGVERMQKAIVELICKKHHIKEVEKESVYALLMRHEHVKLNDWIEKSESIKIDKRCRKLLEILSRFYNTVRYARFSDESYLKSSTQEYDLLLELHSKSNMDIDTEIKNSFGKRLGILSNQYFEEFYDLCHELQVFAYELECDSAANIVFGYQTGPKNLYDELDKRKHARMEVLYWLMKNAEKLPEFSEATDPALDFDPFDFIRYISEIIHNAEDGYACYDTVDYLYDELCEKDKEKWEARLLLIEYIFADM